MKVALKGLARGTWLCFSHLQRPSALNSELRWDHIAGVLNVIAAQERFSAGTDTRYASILNPMLLQKTCQLFLSQTRIQLCHSLNANPRKSGKRLFFGLQSLLRLLKCRWYFVEDRPPIHCSLESSGRLAIGADNTCGAFIPGLPQFNRCHYSC